MRNLLLTTAARAARNQGFVDALLTGSGAASIRFYSAASGGTLLATRTLASPGGATVRPADGRIVLTVSASVELVAATGAVLWAELVAADGTSVFAPGEVTDEAGFAGAAGAATDTGDIGPWVLAGTSGTQVYEGGVVQLTTAVIG